jgi:thiamine-triphosphatase
MIEVEQKFSLNKEEEANLIKDADLFSDKHQDDTYYDSPDYSLTCKDIWLRKRNGDFQVKLPEHELGKKLGFSHYTELETDDEIRNHFKLSNSGDMEKDLADAGYLPVVNFTSQRRSYKLDKFRIDLDITNFGYEIAEIEIVVDNQDGREAAENMIRDFALSKGLEMKPIHGKVLELICRKHPEHYKALGDAGVLWM